MELLLLIVGGVMESSEGEGTEKGIVHSGEERDPARGLVAAFGLPKSTTPILPMGRTTTEGNSIQKCKILLHFEH